MAMRDPVLLCLVEGRDLKILDILPLDPEEGQASWSRAVGRSAFELEKHFCTSFIGAGGIVFADSSTRDADSPSRSDLNPFVILLRPVKGSADTPVLSPLRLSIVRDEAGSSWGMELHGEEGASTPRRSKGAGSIRSPQVAFSLLIPRLRADRDGGPIGGSGAGNPRGEASRPLDALRRELADCREESSKILHELFHRTRNSLQLVQSLISLESSLSAPAAPALERLERRISLIAAVQDAIVADSDGDTVGLAEVARQVVSAASRTGGVARVDLNLSARSPRVAVDQATHVGLVLGELVRLAEASGTGPVEEVIAPGSGSGCAVSVSNQHGEEGDESSCADLDLASLVLLDALVVDQLGGELCLGRGGAFTATFAVGEAGRA